MDAQRIRQRINAGQPLTEEECRAYNEWIGGEALAESMIAQRWQTVDVERPDGTTYPSLTYIGDSNAIRRDEFRKGLVLKRNVRRGLIIFALAVASLVAAVEFWRAW